MFLFINFPLMKCLRELGYKDKNLLWLTILEVLDLVQIAHCSVSSGCTHG